MDKYVGVLEIVKFTNKHWFTIGLILIVVCLTIAVLDTKITYVTQEPSIPDFGEIDIVSGTKDLNIITIKDMNLNNKFAVIATPILRGVL